MTATIAAPMNRMALWIRSVQITAEIPPSIVYVTATTAMMRMALTTSIPVMSCSTSAVV